MQMSRSLRKLSLSAALVLAISQAAPQKPDSYDTLPTRGRFIVVARYDTIKQLKEANRKADTILTDLEFIRAALNISDTNDTVR